MAIILSSIRQIIFRKVPSFLGFELTIFNRTRTAVVHKKISRWATFKVYLAGQLDILVK
jgi:hypothetical protein